MMAVSTGAGVMEILIIVFMGGSLGGSGLPVGLPPAPHDSLLDHVAPEDCLAYLAWNAMADPNPDSSNQTEQLLAEREIQHFVSKTTTVLLQKMRDEASRSERDRKMAMAVPELLRVLLTHATAVYVSPEAGIPSGGLICRVGDHADKVERWLTTIQEVVVGEDVKRRSESGSTVYTWPSGSGIPSLSWTIADDCLVAGLGDGELESLIARRKAEATPRWLAQIADRIPVSRPASLLHVNVAGIMKMVSPMLPQEAAVGLRASGLQEILSVNTVTGLSETDCVTRTWVQTTGQHSGLLTFLKASPLTADDLQRIPADVRFATVVRLEPMQLLEAGLAAIEEVEPQAATMVRGQLAASRQMIGLDLQEDILAAFGNNWRIYQSPSEGGDPVTGWTAVVSLRKPEKIRDLTNTLKGFVAAQRQGRRNTVRIDTFDAVGNTAYFVNVIGEEIPVAPAWCVTEDELIISLYPQGITSYLTRDESAQKLSDISGVQSQLGTRSVAFSYCDTAALFDLAWPFIRAGATMLGSELQREGIDLNVSVLPSRHSIARHLTASMSSLSVADDGFEVQQRRTFPLGLEPVVFSGLAFLGSAKTLSGPVGISGDAVAMAPAAVMTLAASRRTASQNNLRQLMLAIHNYHAVHSKFPKAVTLDANGNPGLSWRVHLLPYLEEQSLYNQFHLDEPWDSEHNRPLISQMPAVFRSPGSDADAGMTNYVGFRTEGAIFEESDHDLRMRDVVDGLSNTLAIVEADDDHAVIWSKPDDLVFDEKSPRKGLKSPSLREGFLGALGDGSVRVIEPYVPDEIIRRLVLRNDGQVINEF